MRFSLFILGIFSALICIEKPAEAQNQPWCIYKDDGEGNPQCRYATHWNNAWPTASATAPVHPVRTHPRRGHRVDARAAALRNDYGLRKSFGRNFGILATMRWKPIPRVLEATPGIEPG